METDKDSRTFSRQADARVVIKGRYEDGPVLIASEFEGCAQPQKPAFLCFCQRRAACAQRRTPCRTRRAAVLKGRAVLFPSV